MLKTNLILLLLLAAGASPMKAAAEPQPKNNGEYDIHEDGGIIYNPLSREARRKGELSQSAPKKSGTLELGDLTLKYKVPRSANAYDVVPVEYELEKKTPDPKRPIAVECTAFQEKARSGGKPLFDMSLPGDLSVKFDYIGCVCADAVGAHPLLDLRKPDPAMKNYPGWKSDPLTRSGVIRKADYVWFTFKYTVAGNTIFDPEGFNGVQSEAELFKKQPDGKYKSAAKPINLWERNVNYQYPGESCEQTLLLPGDRGRMKPGEYRLRFSLLQKSYTKWTQWGNHWGGEPFASMDVFLTVVEGKPEATEPKIEQQVRAHATRGNFPEFIHSFEEFMTGFEWYRSPVSNQKSVVYVQVAPWTENIDVKLIMGNPMELKTASIPITVSTEKIRLKYNPENPFVVTRDGKKEPVIMAQLMPTMRHSIHFGSRPDLIMQDLVKDAMNCGVNLYCSESGGWALADFVRTPQNWDAGGEANRYFNQMLKSTGMPMVGHGIYPVEEAYKLGSKLLDVPLKPGIEIAEGYGAKHFAYPEWSQSWAAIALYNHQLWGDNWYKTRDGKTIIDIEDSAGWMREDINIRHAVGKKNIADFREWSRKKYGIIEKVNAAWSSSYKDFAEINPEADQTLKKPSGFEYYQKTNPVFYEWSPALRDFDYFMSEARATRYKEVMEIVRKTIPGATFSLRTEGGNFIIPDTSKLGDTPHELHVKNSARRNAEVGEVLSKYKDVISFYSDYTTLPYTPDEWRKFTKLSVEAGIRPMPLPHMARTRDMAVQQKYGNDYTVHYSLKYPAKAAMIYGLQAFFPVMKAVYEEGGCCGIIWADYLCDAFVTETQKKELKILRTAMNQMEKVKSSQKP